MTFKVLSYGGGVQSTAMILMIRDGVLPKPDLIVFADTGSERPETIALIENVIRPIVVEMGIDFRIARSHLGALDEYYRNAGALPMIGMRHCTAKFKIRPIRKVIREYVGNVRGVKAAEAWLGITTDEAQREGESDVKWIANRYPLLEMNISRQDCIDYLDAQGFEVVKSGCFMCPYQSGDEWVSVRDNYPSLWNRSLSLEAAYFKKRPHRWKGLRYDGKRLTDNLDSFASSKCDSGGCFI